MAPPFELLRPAAGRAAPGPALRALGPEARHRRVSV